MKNILISVGVVLALVLSVVAVTKPASVEQMFGSASGPFYTELQQFRGGLVDGGSVYATTTTAATETLTAAVMERSKVIRFLGSATAAAMTVSLPASTSWPFMNAPGDYRTWIIENGYTAAATTTTIAAGTGVDLQEPDGQNVVIGINNYAFLTCYREASSDIVCSVDETIPAD